MAIKNFLFAALDCIIDREKNIYFIEINSSPGALKEYKKAYSHCRPVEKLCDFMNNDFKHMAVISKKNWDKSIISNEYRKRFKGEITFCPYKKNKSNMKKGSGYLLNIKNEKIIPDIILRVAAGRAIAQEKAGIKVINPYCTSKLTIDKIKVKQIVKKYAGVNVPRSFEINNKQEIKKLLIENKQMFADGFIIKPRKGQKSIGVHMFNSYDEIPENIIIDEPYILEEIITPLDLFKGEFFEIRSMAVNGKYVGAMVFVSPKRPMHLFTEGRAEKIPEFLENDIKILTEKIVKVIDDYASK